jgi:2-methylcitrate dehydratase PrpD
VQAALDLVASDDPAPEDVAAIEIVLPGDLAQVVDNRLMPDINVQYLVAGSLLDRRFTFAMAHDADRMHKPDVVALMARTTLVPDPAVSGVRTATVTLTMSDGRRLSRHVAAVRGTVDDPMSRQELVDKSLDLLVPVLDMIAVLPELADARALGELLR